MEVRDDMLNLEILLDTDLSSELSLFTIWMIPAKSSEAVSDGRFTRILLMLRDSLSAASSFSSLVTDDVERVRLRALSRRDLCFSFNIASRSCRREDSKAESEAGGTVC